ncbi:hypothetical protein BOX15_Mlig007683g2 [Macrostomum lignano]|uniref:Innexin n=1 Tax=Macrostomum lignano TaxID=282301 RepID=A0A267GBF6_9PLAT|nr:hypothetical protein BOX15_Mlig007683g2 [Macrostomum lignano]
MSHMPYNLIFFKLIFYLMECMHNFQLLPQDFADSLSSHLSVTINSCILVMLMTKMFFFSTIECVSPSEWPESWEKAAEAICLTDGTYRMPQGVVNATTNTSDSEWHYLPRLPIDYYYWIPYIFMGQAVILKSPDFFWHFYCSLDTEQPIEIIKAFAFLVGNQELMRRDCDSSGVKAESLANCTERQRWTARIADHLLSRNKLINFDSCHLFVVYMLFKVLRLAAVIGSLFYLQAVFGLDSPLFGLSMASNSLMGETWEDTNLFPRWAYCDVYTRHLGNWNTRVMQCALPINMLLEHLIMFYWFWLLLCVVCLLLSAACWIVAMLPPSRRQFAQTFLNYLRVGEQRQNIRRYSKKKIESRLIEKFSCTDRAFMLRLAEDRVGLAAVYLAMDGMAEISTKTVV